MHTVWVLCFVLTSNPSEHWNCLSDGWSTEDECWRHGAAWVNEDFDKRRTARVICLEHLRQDR